MSDTAFQMQRPTSNVQAVQIDPGTWHGPALAVIAVLVAPLAAMTWAFSGTGPAIVSAAFVSLVAAMIAVHWTLARRG